MRINLMVRFLIYPLIVLFLFHSCRVSAPGVLIEAESFAERGGWVIDPQFVEQMGSPYLLAHGLGVPVKNAMADISLPAEGRYHVWARTKNWAPGDWDAPGRFKIIINGSELEEVLGTNGDWDWQYAGKTKVLEKTASLELKDLTGFEGRCDAIYFSPVKEKPPSLSGDLKLWRTAKSSESETPDETLDFDLVITGGGIAGCAASIAAAEQGLKVALIHDRPILGGNASSEIRVHTEGITWKSDRILSMLNTVWWPNGSPDAVQDDKKRHSNIEKYENISIFLNRRAFSVKTDAGKIKSVDARHTSNGKIMRFTAPLFIDCTGDGWIGYWSGAEYMYGREDSSTYGERWNTHEELWSPAKPDNRVMGSSVLWRSYNAGKPVSFPEVPWAMEVADSYSAISGTWKWEFSHDTLHQIEDAEYIRDHMLKAIYGSFYNARQKPGNENLALEWVSYLVGKRESRRLVGDYIYTFNDEREMREFPDAVVMEERDIDVHYQQILKDPDQPDFLSEALFYKVDHYYIPYRSLYSKNIGNLFMAGRCFSCSHVGLGGPRVMHTTGQMGVAVGYAASLCKKYNTNPREIWENHISELKNLIFASDKSN
jgi:hypothetical protein